MKPRVFRCGHCKRLAPTWEELGTKLLDNKLGIVIAKVDCTQELSKDLCNQEGVSALLFMSSLVPPQIPIFYRFRQKENLSE